MGRASGDVSRHWTTHCRSGRSPFQTLSSGRPRRGSGSHPGTSALPDLTTPPRSPGDRPELGRENVWGSLGAPISTTTSRTTGTTGSGRWSTRSTGPRTNRCRRGWTGAHGTSIKTYTQPWKPSPYTRPRVTRRSTWSPRRSRRSEGRPSDAGHPPQSCSGTGPDRRRGSEAKEDPLPPETSSDSPRTSPPAPDVYPVTDRGEGSTTWGSGHSYSYWHTTTAC